MRTFKEPKTVASRRTMPLSPTAITALGRHRKRQRVEQVAAGPAYARDGLVFTDELGAPLPPDRVSSAFRRIVVAADLPQLTLHGPAYVRHGRARRRGRCPIRSRTTRPLFAGDHDERLSARAPGPPRRCRFRHRGGLP